MVSYTAPEDTPMNRDERIVNALKLGPQIKQENWERAQELTSLLQELAATGDQVALLQVAQMATGLALQMAR